jgi:hypothetical protein
MQWDGCRCELLVWLPFRHHQEEIPVSEYTQSPSEARISENRVETRSVDCGLPSSPRDVPSETMPEQSGEKLLSLIARGEDLNVKDRVPRFLVRDELSETGPIGARKEWLPALR